MKKNDPLRMQALHLPIFFPAYQYKAIFPFPERWWNTFSDTRPFDDFSADRVVRIPESITGSRTGSGCGKKTTR